MKSINILRINFVSILEYIYVTIINDTFLSIVNIKTCKNEINKRNKTYITPIR